MSVDKILSNCDFSMLKGKVDGRILKAIKCLGFVKPTRIQAEALPHLMSGKDVIGAAKTGSGKTFAFLIPVVDKLLKLGFTKKHGTGCIILSPTRELALQTNNVLKKLLTEIDLSHCLIVGGEKKTKDILSLKNGSNIIVSTPGRLLDHLQNTQSFKCENLKCLVVDEADKLLEAGFEKHITGIISLLPIPNVRQSNVDILVEGKIDFVNDTTFLGITIDSKLQWGAHVSKGRRQTILFSATIDNKVKSLAKLALRANPVLISVNGDKQSTVPGLQQGYCICPVENRIPWLYKMLKKTKKLKVMVFFSSCKSVDFHYDFFKIHCGATVLSIHGKQSQSRRKEAYQSFIETSSGSLFCTDVAARGLDIPSVDWIVQYDPPTDPKEYIHRVGRTARGLNQKGNAVILLRPEEEEFVNFLQKEKEYIHRVGRTARGLNQKGNAVILLRPEEEEFVNFLQKEKVFLDKYSFGDPPLEIQDMLEDLITKNGVVKTLARRAYLSFLRCYKTHPLKKIFNVKTMDLKLAAKAFGFLEQPDVDFLAEPKFRNRIAQGATGNTLK